MTRWTWFLVGITIIVLLTVVLAALTARATRQRQRSVPEETWGDPQAMLGISRLSLYLNAVGSQGVLLIATAALIAITGVALSDLWLPGALGWLPAVAIGVVIGLVLAVGNLGIQVTFDTLGISYDDSLRALLSPDDWLEWVVLLVVVLPVVAGFEELLFRGILIGGLYAGFEVSMWLLAVLSSVVFAAGHGLQGVGGLLAAFILGFALAGAFIVTESLVVVVVAHYVVNAVEFARYR